MKPTDNQEVAATSLVLSSNSRLMPGIPQTLGGARGPSGEASVKTEINQEHTWEKGEEEPQRD